MDRMQDYLPSPNSMRQQKKKEEDELRYKLVEVAEPHGDLKLKYLRKLGEFSRCIQPYLRNVHDKYANQWIMIYEGHQPELKLYCKNELEEARKIMYELQITENRI